MAADPDVFRGLVKWQMGTFFRDDALRQQFFPIIYAQFAATPSTIPGFLALNSDLVNVFRSNIASALAGRLNALDHIVRLAWGDQDRYFDVNEAQALQAIIPNSELILVKGAVTRVGTKSFSHEMRLHEADSMTHCATAKSVEVCFDTRERKAVAFPEDVRARLGKIVL